ncbi:MAG: macro domain-containing protein [Anaerolineae bacterium]|nr:macro domain-containing protein [Anaerolineae bacterium]
MKAKVNKVNIRMIQDELLGLSVGALVHVTDPNLSLDPVFASEAGPDVTEACLEIGWCRVGSAVMTTAGNLCCEKLIHAVAPRWGEGSERGKLANLTRSCLWLAEEHGLKSLALPAISSGTLGYPLESCARLMIAEIIDFTFEDIKNLRSVVVCLENALAWEVFDTEFARTLDRLRARGEGKVKV